MRIEERITAATAGLLLTTLRTMAVVWPLNRIRIQKYIPDRFGWELTVVPPDSSDQIVYGTCGDTTDGVTVVMNLAPMLGLWYRHCDDPVARTDVWTRCIAHELRHVFQIRTGLDKRPESDRLGIEPETDARVFTTVLENAKDRVEEPPVLIEVDSLRKYAKIFADSLASDGMPFLAKHKHVWLSDSTSVVVAAARCASNRKATTEAVRSLRTAL